MKTKNRRRNREIFSDNSYWQSYSDMMAALLLIFVLIIAITLAIYRQKTVDLEQSQNSLGIARQELEEANRRLREAGFDRYLEAIQEQLTDYAGTKAD